MTESQFKGIAVFPSKQAYDNLSPKPEGVFCVYPDSPVVKTGTLNPVSSTVADFVGQFFLNTVYGDLFQCTAISNGVYKWKEIGGSGGSPIYRHNVTISGDTDVFVMTAHYYSTSEDPFTFEELVSGTTKFEMFDFVSLKAIGSQPKSYGIGKANRFWYNDMGGGDFEYGILDGMFNYSGSLSDYIYNIVTWYDGVENYFVVDDAIYEV